MHLSVPVWEPPGFTQRMEEGGKKEQPQSDPDSALPTNL